MKSLPKILLYSRLVFCFLIAFCALAPFENANYIVLVLLYLGIISDVFDGIIARKYGVDTTFLRVADTVIDLMFYLTTLCFVYSIFPNFFSENILVIVIILSLELVMYLVSFIKFFRSPSPHAIMSKFWGVYLVIEISLMLFNVAGQHFRVALFIGLIAHIDRLLIYLILKEWTHDIPSSYHAYQLRRGYTIKRNKLFN